MNMPDDYSPRDLVTQPYSNPIFKYEVKLLDWLDWSSDLDDPRSTDWNHVWAIFGVQFIAVIVLAICRSIMLGSLIGGPIIDGLIFTIVVIAPLAATFIVDIYTASGSVTFWHARAQADRIDALRLTVPTDAELLNTLQAVGELNVWRGMRWEMALRSFIPYCGIALCLIAGVVLFIGFWMTASRPYYTNYDLGVSFLVALFCVWLVRMLMLTMREPLWRMRTLVTLSFAVADNIKETNMAILIAVAAALGLKVVQFGVVIAIVFSVAYALNPQTNPIICAAWLVISGLFITRMVRAAYARLQAWGMRITLRSMQGNATPLISVVSDIATRFGQKSVTSTIESL